MARATWPKGGDIRLAEPQAEVHHRHGLPFCRLSRFSRPGAQGHEGGRNLRPDPAMYAMATRIPYVSYNDFIKQGLGHHGHHGVAMARDNNVPIRVFDIFRPGARQARSTTRVPTRTIGPAV